MSYGDGGEGAPSRPSSLPYAAPNPAGDSSAADTDSTASDLAAYAGSAALSSAEGSNAINFAVPPLWRSNHSSPTAWFRSAIGRIAMGLGETIFSSFVFLLLLLIIIIIIIIC